MWKNNSTENYISSKRSRNHNLILYFIVVEITGKMFNLIFTIVIVFNLLLYAPTTVTSPNSEVEKKEPDEKLVRLHTTEVLPLILFHDEDSLDNEPTLDLQETITPVIYGGKLAGGTKFSTETSNEPRFYCPEHWSDKICLKPHEFKENQSLECHQEASPVARKGSQQNSCGFHKRGIILNIGYEICTTEGDSIDSQDEQEQNRNKLAQIYTVCYSYDENNDDLKTRPIYTIHYIRAPKLLKSEALVEEHNVTFPFLFYQHEAPNNKKYKKSNSLKTPLDPNYDGQMLVPVEDMAFGLWRKTTKLIFNIQWQHEKLIPLWNEINDYVRVKAIQMTNVNTGIKIHTGQFSIPIVPEDKKKISAVWVKMITTVPSDVETHPIEGIAILMNNFLEDNPMRMNPETIAEMCDEDLCIENLKKKFTDIGGRVRCCSLKNGKVGQLFDQEDTIKGYPELKIPGINVKETDQHVDVID